jgi:molecular chaperone GrpE
MAALPSSSRVIDHAGDAGSIGTGLDFERARRDIRREPARTIAGLGSMSDENKTNGAEGASSWVDPAILAEAEAEKLRAEVADLKDKVLRTLAEMENLRRRTEREVKDAGTYAVTKFARDMLAVADNLRRAIETAPAEARAEGSAAKPVLEGVELTERALLQTFERHGVKPIEAVGAKFDPNLHQAVFEIPNPDVPNGTVLQVMQSGYVIADRVLRAAMVGVAKGGPKPAAPVAPDGEGETAA